MADQSVPALQSYLREAEIRRGIELLYFGYSHLTRSIDAELATQGLGRAHHRTLYFVAREPDLTVSALLRLLNVTKQSLSRVINDLSARRLIEHRTGASDRRHRLLRLTAEGAKLEAELFEQLRAKLGNAYSDAEPDAIPGFWRILEGLIPADELDQVIGLSENQG